ncbi:acyltransferase family protein [Parvularcula sp. IMCC14364]|uniref:acyltransferase family protein n=1 Tax=Parvularcula sp. IMCC14364 TaxID=3067902 RepID=UPI0027408DBB|nr:acyltransferase family protein [Parvularcula sp. IMCC14364]
MTAPQTRLHGLDFLRSLMMSLGIVLHAAQMYLTMPIMDYYWDTARSPSMDALLIWINTFRMPVFYLLSGFFTALLLDRRGQRYMIKNRFRRIAVPFFLFLPALAGIMTILRIIAQHVMVTGEFGFDLNLIEDTRIFWDNTHNLWFLYYLMFHVATAWILLGVWGALPDFLRRGLSVMAQLRWAGFGAIVLYVCLGLAAIGSLSPAGRISADLSFVPDVKVYFYFGLCFLLGWLSIGISTSCSPWRVAGKQA